VDVTNRGTKSKRVPPSLFSHVGTGAHNTSHFCQRSVRKGSCLAVGNFLLLWLHGSDDELLSSSSKFSGCRGSKATDFDRSFFSPPTLKPQSVLFCKKQTPLTVESGEATKKAVSLAFASFWSTSGKKRFAGLSAPKHVIIAATTASHLWLGSLRDFPFLWVHFGSIVDHAHKVLSALVLLDNPEFSEEVHVVAILGVHSNIGIVGMVQSTCDEPLQKIEQQLAVILCIVGRSIVLLVLILLDQACHVSEIVP
jgi:hypothetical protein